MNTDYARYSTDALERIKEEGEKKLLAFVDDIAPKTASSLTSYLPTVSGFRKTSNSGLAHRKKALAKAFAGAKGTSLTTRSHADMALYAFWRAWGREHLGDVKLFNKLIETFEKSAEDNEPGEVTQTVVDLFESLRSLSYRNVCDREAMERLFRFSPFQQSETLAEIIAQSKGRDDVERDRSLSSLPDRLKDDEQEIRSLDAQVRELSAALSNVAAGLKDHREEVAHALTAWGNAPAESVREGRLEELAETLDRTLKESLTAIDRKINDLGERIGKAGDAHKKPVDALEELLASLEARLKKVEATVSEAPPSVDDVDVKTQLPPIVIAGRRPTIQPLATGHGSKTTSLTDAKSIAAALKHNFEQGGLKPSSAETLAEEVAAAIITRQIVTFRGSKATDIARLAAVAVGGARTWRAAMPIGTPDGFDLRTDLMTLERDEQHAPALVVEGINRVPLDAIADDLADIAGQSSPVSQLGAEAAVFASFSEGLAGLPLEAANLELGPVFDLSSLDWRVRKADTKALTFGILTTAALKDLRSKLTLGGESIDEAQRLASKFGPRSARFEGHVAAASSALATVLHRQRPTATQSIAFGWLAPRWIATGVTATDADSELDGGRCDAPDADPRLAAILSSGDFADKGEP